MIRRSARVPIAVVVACTVFGATAVVMVFAGGWTTGVSWDEPYYEGALKNFLAEGWFAGEVVDGQPLGVNAYVYAPVFQLFAHGLTAIVGFEPWNDVSTTPEAYAVRHLAVGVLAVAGLAAAAAIVRLLLGSWRWGVVAAAILGSVALWAGHGMFNVTDMPVAAGYTILTLGLIAIGAAGSATSRFRSLCLGVATSALGIVVAVGTRPGTWPAVLLSVLIALAGIVALSWTSGRDRRSTWLGLGSVVVACVIAYLALLAIYPKMFIRPLTTLRAAVSQSANFDGGQRDSSLADVAAYIPTWLYRQLPIVVMVLLVAGLACAAWLLARPLRRARRDPHPQDAWRALAVVLILAQLLVMPVASIVLRSNVYDGIRQFLFVIPPIAILATLGLWALVTLAAGVSKPITVLRTSVWVVLCAAIAVPLVDQIRLFPYNYVYVNELAGRQLDEHALQTDYWRTSMRELIPFIPSQGATSCGFDPLGAGMPPNDCAVQGQFSPYWWTRGNEAVDLWVPASDYLFVETNRGRWTPSPEFNCAVLDQVTRPLHGREVTMSYVALCPMP